MSQPGRSLNYHYLYKFTKEKNVSFSSLVNLQMEFAVIETFILIMEERFSLVFYEHNRTTSPSSYQFNKYFSVSICERSELLFCAFAMF